MNDDDIEDDEEQDDELGDQSQRSVEERWFCYKQACREDGTEPMSWGEWQRKGQPVPDLS